MKTIRNVALLFSLLLSACAVSTALVPWGAKDQSGLAYNEPDHDEDGITNLWDRCPDLPEDRDGHRDGDGCPDPDNDGDGRADAKDPQ